jgi:hypothetical protein
MGGSLTSSSTTAGGGGSGAGGAGVGGAGGTGIGGATSTTTTSSGMGGSGGGVCGLGAGSLCWAERFGNGTVSPAAVATDSNGNILVTGYFLGKVDFGAGLLTSVGDLDMFVAKFSASGTVLWSKRFGDADGQFGRGIAEDPAGDIIVLCAFAGSIDFGGGPLTSKGGSSYSGFDIGLVKFDGAGNFKWAKSFGDADLQQGMGLAVDDSGNIIIDGLSRGTVDFGGAPLTSIGPYGSLFAAKLDHNGAHLWSKLFQNTGNAFPPELWRVAVDSQKNVVFAGAFVGSIDFGAGPLVSAGQRDVFTVKIDPGGGLAWAKRFGDALDQEGTQAVVDPSGNVFVTGNFNGSLNFGSGAMTSAGSGDIFLAKLDPSGEGLWSKRLGDAMSNNMGRAWQEVVADAAGNAIISGSLGGNADFGGGILIGGQLGDAYPYVAKFDGNGTYAWAFTGTSDGVNAQALGADPSGNVIVSGQLSKPISFAGASLTPTGSIDVYVLKLSP